MSDEHIDFDELRQERDDFLLGQNELKRPDHMKAAMLKMQNPDADYADLLDETRGEYPDYRTTYNGERKALEAERADQEAKAASEAEQRQREENAQRLKEEYAPQLASRWSESDQQSITQVQAAADQHKQEMANLARAERFMEQHPDQVTDEMRKLVEDERTQLQQNEKTLSQAYQRVQAAASMKQREGLRAQLPAELRDDPETKEKFIAWAEGEGMHRSAVTSETDPTTLGMLFRQFQSAEKENQRKAKQQRVSEWARRHIPKAAGFDRPTSSAQAKEQLRQTGSMKDALSALTLEKAERLL